MSPLTNPDVCSEHYDCKECSEYLDYAVAAARSETLAEAYKIARGGDNRFEKHGARQLYWKGRSDAAMEIRSLDTTHLSEIRELEIRIAEAKWWRSIHSIHSTASVPNGCGCVDCERVSSYLKQLESLRGRGKG